MINKYNIMVGKSQEKTPFRSSTCGWEGEEMSFREKRCENMDLMQLRIGSGGRMFLTQQWTFGFRKVKEFLDRMSNCEA
jgi:hypothetical protein